MQAKRDDDWNFGAFQRAALLLRALGHDVVNPAEVDMAVWSFDGREQRDLKPRMDRRHVLGLDVGMLLPTCDAIYMLRGWSESTGAMAELAMAQALGMQVMFEPGAERGRVGAVLIREEAGKGD
jgi:hypothetical protein